MPAVGSPSASAGGATGVARLMDDENVTRGIGMLRRIVHELIDFPEFLCAAKYKQKFLSVSYTHLRAHETSAHL
eukprot:1324987-Alexandrium_andersonii.AAC.1